MEYHAKWKELSNDDFFFEERTFKSIALKKNLSTKNTHLNNYIFKNICKQIVRVSITRFNAQISSFYCP